MSMWIEMARLGTEGQKALAADATATCSAIFFGEGEKPADLEDNHSIGRRRFGGHERSPAT